MADKIKLAVRNFCLECQGGDAPAVAACADSGCLLFSFRPCRDKAPNFTGPDVLRAVRRFCMTCVGDRREVRGCAAKDSCALWSFRFGVHPATFKRVLARRRNKRGLLCLPGLQRG